MFKNVFSYESYLDCINNDKRRKTLGRFRLSSHSLSIKTGRYNGLKEINANVYYLLKMFANQNITFRPVSLQEV